MRKTTYFPDEVLEHIFNYLKSHKDRNNLSLVCKTWYKVERFSRQRVLISNCYALVPQRLITRFPNLRALTLKGRPRFDWVPLDWGGFVLPWIEALANDCPYLEQLILKRMVVSDQDLELISHSFPKFKALVLVNCHGFTTEGLATIAANCRLLEVLDVQGNEVEDNRGEWLSCFPESCASLVSLNFASLKGGVDLVSLERLVARCPNLRSLRLNKAVPFDMLHKILARAPQLVELGIGSYVQIPNSEAYVKLRNAVLNCQSLQTLSGFLEVTPQCLPVIYPICSNLGFLNLSCTSGVPGFELIKLVRQCQSLQRLWILDSIGDKGLEVVASTCKELEELRMFPSDLFGAGYSPITEEGLVAISMGCPKLHSLLYLCRQMTNAALITVAKNCPKFTCFRLHILDSSTHDHSTLRPLDEGFGAIVQSCKELRQLAISGLLTDQVFLYIGMYAEQLETFSVDSAGGSDTGMLYVLNGCRNLRKLEIRNCPFGDTALQADPSNYETIHLLWMSSRKITLGGCMALARKVPMLNVEIINEMDQIEENPDECMAVEKMYLYRTLDGPRKDAPESVWIL